MDENTRANIESSARHAIVEIEGVVRSLDNPDHAWHALRAAFSRLSYIDELLRDARHEPPAR
jgi:hypothetical protein